MPPMACTPNEQGSRLAAETIGQVILEHKEKVK